jgi:hypothetical protein
MSARTAISLIASRWIYAAPGIEVWTDRNDIVGGQRWKTVLRKAIQNGAFFVACYSKEFNTRAESYMHEELRLAIDRLRKMPADRVWFIPVFLNETHIPAHDISDHETLDALHTISLYGDWHNGPPDRSIAAAKVARVITEATRPLPGRSRWSIRSMSRHAGVSASSVQRIWSKNDLKPHRLKTFKLSNDPRFEEKFWDVIGLYLNPPTNALVLCCDEKSQRQALERTQLGLPLAAKRPRTMTHDYVRHGTVTLFAALEQLTGRLITRTEASHSDVEWLRFLKQIDRETHRASLTSI